MSDVSGDIVVTLERGLSSGPARRISQVAHEYSCTVTLQSPRGTVANARNMLELLMLGIARGEPVAIRCVGVDARPAFDALGQLLGAGA